MHLEKSLRKLRIVLISLKIYSHIFNIESKRMIYYDDFETANPLGSKSAQTWLYCILRNLPQNLNSVLTEHSSCSPLQFRAFKEIWI